MKGQFKLKAPLALSPKRIVGDTETILQPLEGEEDQAMPGDGMSTQETRPQNKALVVES